MSPEDHTFLKSLPQGELFQKITNICTIVNSVTDEQELLNASLNMVLDLFEAERGSIFILDPDGQNLTLKSSAGMKRGEKEVMVKRLGQGIVGQVAQKKVPVVVSDISADTRFQNYKSRKSYRSASFICVPLLIKDRLIGVANMSDKRSGNEFREEEMQLLDFLGAQIALNFHRIQLYQKFKETIRRTHNLKDELGEKSKETYHLKQQVYINERLATIGKLAGGIAHEFNNPLDGVMRYTNLSLEHTQEDEVLRGYLFEIKHGLTRMASIVRNLLACSRNVPLRTGEIDIAGNIDHVLKGLEAEIRAKNVEILLELDPGLPTIPDYGLEQILTNLIRNAIDAIGLNGCVTIKVSSENETITMIIGDNGEGIPERNIESIFEPFFTTKEHGKGCGLGLTIVAEIIKIYHGTIDVESVKGKGTAFRIRIPLE